MSIQEPSPAQGPDPSDVSADRTSEARTAAFDSTAAPPPAAPLPEEEPVEQGPRVGTIVWGLIILALAALIIISRLGIVALNGTYVLIGLMIGAGAALVIGGLWSMRGRSRSGTGTGTLK